MPQAEFSPEGVLLRLSPKEYAFIHQALSYVLYGVKVPDFRILMAVERDEGERIADILSAQEREAKESGSHW
jgi:hypothetical protein